MTDTVDTTGRTERLDRMKAGRREKRAELGADRDITPEAKNRRLNELEKEHAEKFAAESGRIMGDLDREIEAAYRRAHAPRKPSRDSRASSPGR